MGSGKREGGGNMGLQTWRSWGYKDAGLRQPWWDRDKEFVSSSPSAVSRFHVDGRTAAVRH